MECGNGRIDVEEECDDGNHESGDGCDNCSIELGWDCLPKRPGPITSKCSTVCGDEFIVEGFE